MKRLLLALALACVVGFVFAGCEERAKTAEEVAEVKVLMAQDIDDGAPKLVPTQTQDYVSGLSIKPEFFTDYQGKRVYFNSAESVKKFEADPETYLKRWGIIK